MTEWIIFSQIQGDTRGELNSDQMRLRIHTAINNNETIRELNQRDSEAGRAEARERILSMVQSALAGMKKAEEKAKKKSEDKNGKDKSSGKKRKDGGGDGAGAAGLQKLLRGS